MSMIEHFLMESPLRTLALVKRNRVLSGLYMPDHLRGPKVNSLGFGGNVRLRRCPRAPQ
jgi:methylated-DNA-[protein]-cysteine S-methyltransferase